MDVPAGRITSTGGQGARHDGRTGWEAVAASARLAEIPDPAGDDPVAAVPSLAALSGTLCLVLAGWPRLAPGEPAAWRPGDSCVALDAATGGLETLGYLTRFVETAVPPSSNVAVADSLAG